MDDLPPQARDFLLKISFLQGTSTKGFQDEQMIGNPLLVAAKLPIHLYPYN